jgi:Secretion system C-terminal sorting domain
MMRTKVISLDSLAGILCLGISTVFKVCVFGQIVYTDIPDATPSVNYSLDLNNDNTTDFSVYHGSLTSVYCSPQGDNAYAGELVNGQYLAWALNSPQDICDTLSTWYDSINPGLLALGNTTGHWVGATDKYLPLRLVVNSNTYYGWVRLDIFPGSTSFTVKDYAYNSVPGACIQSGQTTLGLNESPSQAVISVFPNPFVSEVTIAISNNLNEAYLTIYNAYGQVLKRVDHLYGTKFTLTRDDLPSGVFFMQLMDGNEVIAIEKLMITD